MMIKFVKVLWVSVSLFVLYITLDSFSEMKDRNIYDVLTRLMYFLSFPASFIAAGVLWVIEKFFLITIASKTSYVLLVTIWGWYFILGYFQWFKIIPFLIKKIKWL